MGEKDFSPCEDGKCPIANQIHAKFECADDSSKEKRCNECPFRDQVLKNGACTCKCHAHESLSEGVMGAKNLKVGKVKEPHCLNGAHCFESRADTCDCGKKAPQKEECDHDEKLYCGNCSKPIRGENVTVSQPQKEDDWRERFSKLKLWRQNPPSSRRKFVVSVE